MIAGDWLGRRSTLTPDKAALIDTLNGNQEVTYRAWNLSANQTANYLHHRFEINKGDRVAVLAKNCVAYLDTWFGLGKLGGILQNLNWRLSARELIGLVDDAGPKVLLYESEFADQVNEIRSQVREKLCFAAIDEIAHPDDVHFEERKNYPDHAPAAIEIGWNDPWVICYTGGTTGIPKGAVLTHRSITANAVNTVISWGLTPDDVTILNSPLFHSGGLNVFTAPLVYNGGTSIVCREFNLDQTFDLLAEGIVTIWFGVPTMFVMMQNHPRWEQTDFSHLKLLISGGAPCPLPVFHKFWEKGVDFKTGYGLTEAGPNTFWLPPEDVQRKPGSVGFPLFHIDVKILRADDMECVPDEIGEIVIRGPHLCDGYWNNPQASASAIHPLNTDPDGSDWLFTGDLGLMDEEGYFYIVGRLKDMFISGGENVYPAEIESVIYSHQAVSEAAVIAIPDPKWGEVGQAVVCLKSNALITEDEMIRYLQENLARYKVPKSVIFVDELPKTGANKIDKQALISKFMDI